MSRDYNALRTEAIALAEQDIDINDIADELEVAASTVYRWLSEADVPLVKSVDKADPEAVIEAYNQGVSVTKICARFDITYTTMYQILAEHDIPLRQSPELQKGRVLAMDAAVQMYQEGHKLRTIQAETGVYSARLYVELEKRGIPLRNG